MHIFVKIFILASLLQICEAYRETLCRGASNQMYCYWDYLHINKVVYGHLSKGRCSRGSSVSAAFDVTTQLQRICFGKKDCNPYDFTNQIFTRDDNYDGTERNMQFVAHFDCNSNPPTKPPITTSPPSSSIKNVEVCENMNRVLSCNGKKINILSATFGNSPNSKCSSNNRQCQTNALSQVRQSCQGAPMCFLSASRDDFGDPCPSYVKGTLNVRYECGDSQPIATTRPPPPPTTQPSNRQKIEVCKDKNRYLTCGANKLRILSATFGNSPQNKCSSNNYVCQTDVLNQIRQVCQPGASFCFLMASNLGNSCPGHIKGSLVIEYECFDPSATTRRPMVTTDQPRVTTTQPFLRKVVCEDRGAFVGCYIPNQVIQVISATFGRTNSQSCPSSYPRNDDVKCSTDIARYMKYHCEGQSFCQANGDAGLYGDPCNNKQTRKFLELKYKCVPRGSFTPLFQRTTMVLPSVPTAPYVATPTPPSANQTAKPYTGQCGRPQVSMSKVVQGTDAKRGFWPWEIAIYTKSGAFICGGSIIAPQWIVSVAHCFKGEDPSKFYIVVGDYDRTTIEGSELKYSIDHVINHPSYANFSSVKHDYDISMVKVSRPIRFGQFVQPACLPTNHNPNQSHCFVT
uniref:Peptidase S1 domain-containing protein n=2 Tax=Clytia hemisphaerica TaxID=252671 RepID=A0A7M5WI84_9CNID